MLIELEAESTIAQLKRLGIRALIMLTGDNERVAAAIAERVGLTDFRGNLLPEEKVSAVKGLLREHGKVAMVGDGVNDASPRWRRSCKGSSSSGDPGRLTARDGCERVRGGMTDGYTPSVSQATGRSFSRTS